MLACRPVALLLLAVVGCTRSPRDVPDGATKVEVYRIDGRGAGHAPKSADPGDQSIFGFAVLAHGKDLAPETARKLAAALDDADRQHVRWAQAGCYWPGVAFRFHRGGQRADLAICFHCSNYYLGPPADHHGQTVATPPAVAAVLARMAKEALPDDKDIQALDDSGHEPPKDR